MDLTIYYAQTESLIKQKLLPQLLQRLPASSQSKALRYKSELSTYNYVVGRLLLKRGLESFGLDNDVENIEFQENGKPLISGLHFNISHSDHQVICGFSKNCQLGVDLEKIIAIDFDDFTAMFSTQEWIAIQSAEDPIRSFYWFWTRKESIIKAVGLNLSYLHQIELDVSCDHFVIDGKRWFLYDINVGKGYVGSLCSEEEVGKIEIVEICF
jgi:4'-phosphopantetheinyl transferase